MLMKRLISMAAIMLLGLAACGADVADSGLSYEKEVEQWRVDRLARLKAPGGYLNQIGLFWLEDGTSSFGGGGGNTFVFAGATDDSIGTFELNEDGVTMHVNDGVDVRVGEERVASMFMSDDTTEEPVTASYGSMAWLVINREGKFGVRVRDFENPALDALPPIPHYATDSAWRIPATLNRYDEPRIANVGTVIDGLGYNPESPGVLEFTIDGEQYELEAYASGERLFLVFGDQTSGRETYGAGRFLYADVPGEDGQTVLDFNLAYNPPCAFNDFSTCPVASPRNRLRIAVTAGEKYESALHFSASAH